jgi:hypothetical protein
VLANRQTQLPDWAAFEKMVALLRKKNTAGKPVAVPMPKGLPPEYASAVDAVRQTVIADLPRILDTTLPARKLFDQTPAFVGRYFWVEDALSEVDHFERETSAAWNKATSGHSDDSSLLTLFLCMAAASTGKTLLTEKSATSLIRKIRKSGMQPELATVFIRANAPVEHQEGYVEMWNAFIDDAIDILTSDHDYTLHDALSLLRRDCNVAE